MVLEGTEEAVGVGFSDIGSSLEKFCLPAINHQPHQVNHLSPNCPGPIQSYPTFKMVEDTVVTSTSLSSLPKIAEGKVRDLYEVDSKTLLFVASDRISAYDVIMENACLPLF